MASFLSAFSAPCFRHLAIGGVCFAGWTALAAPQTVRVLGVTPSRVADLVILDGGFDSGLRTGMIARVTRDGSQVGDVVVVDVRASAATALIVSLVSQQALRPGDITSVKVSKSHSS